MKRLILIVAIIVIMPRAARADEGMWLINTFGKVIYQQMRERGLKLTAGEIYNENAPSLSDAIVAVDGGMGTGSMISEQGLMITNHHVAYGDIHALSTAENNYLENGFWALERGDEIPIKGKTVTFLRRVIDVTDEVRTVIDSLRTAHNNNNSAFGFKVSSIMAARYKDKVGGDYEIGYERFFDGDLALLFCYEVYTDVRLVGAPPLSIGAFGGEQDNWNWPQHKGDFALYRVYGDKDGRPAAYSADNVPIRPAKVLNIATGGVDEGDYTMIIGYPGKTHRYMSSFAVEQKRTVNNPIIIKARRDRLDIMKKHMEADPAVRLLYADKYFNVSNFADLVRWENICLRRYGVTGIREKEEAELQAWIEADPARKERWGTLLPDLERGYAAMAGVERNQTYYRENYFGPSDLISIANRTGVKASGMPRREQATLSIADSDVVSLLEDAARNYAAMDLATDKEVAVKMLEMFTDNVPRELWGEYLAAKYDEFEGDVKTMFETLADNSFVRSDRATREFFAKERTMDEILADPLVAFARSIDWQTFRDQAVEVDAALGYATGDKDSEYFRAIVAMRNDKGVAQYPDANSTMRITYGTVGGIRPRDGVNYDYYSTIAGYSEKYDPDDYEFRVDDRMRSLIAAGDWGRWGEDGQLRVNFLSDNDITGGNSGSPVLNARGDVVGLAFDGNRESMSGDIYFHPEYNKTVTVDIRFVLWVMDKYAGAQSLIDEMNLVK